MKGSHSIEIAAPPERVFEWLGNSERSLQWVPNLVEADDLLRTPEGVGSTFRQVYLERGRRMEMQGVVTAYAPNRRFACALEGPLFNLEVDYRLEDLGGRTRLTEQYDTRFKAWPLRVIGALMSPLMRKASQRQLESSLGRLRQLVERGAARAA